MSLLISCRRIVRPLLLFVLLVVVMLAGMTLVSGSGRRAVAFSLNQVGTRTRQGVVQPQNDRTKPASPIVCPGWNIVPSPNASTRGNYLTGVSALSSNDVWAVGYYFTGSDYLTLVEHWNGTSWSVVPSPNATTYDHLYGVSAVSANDVWAVGSAPVAPFDHTLIEHWDGTSWSIVPSPNMGAYSNDLYGVSAVSASDVWAVGSYNSSSALRTLVEHWNGSSWTIVSSPNAGTGGNKLAGVSAVSANDVWAVGDNNDGSTISTLVEHWNGSSWTIRASPNPGTYVNGLRAVASSAANDVWVVGYYQNGHTQSYTLAMHWDGINWNILPTLNPGIDNYLSGVEAIASNDAWAVGAYSTGGTYLALVQHWDGTSWSVTPSPNGNVGSTLAGVTALSSSDVWAVGSRADDSSTDSTLVEHYISLCATPTPIPPRCPGEHFTDVCPGDYFYEAVLALNDEGIVSGYNTAPPCPNGLWIPCFKPYGTSTRGQISKIVSLAAGFNEPVSGQTFQDVSPNSTFYTYIQRMASRGILSGYPCGGPYETCIPPENRSYFRTNNNVTRGQLSKMISLAFGWTEPVIGQRFQDVPPGSTFYGYIGRLFTRGIISGYVCGGAGEPCVPPSNMPYFRPNNNVLRGQTAKIVDLARTQPTPTSTPTATVAPTLTPTSPASSTPTSGTRTPTDTETPTPIATPTVTATSTP